MVFLFCRLLIVVRLVFSGLMFCVLILVLFMLDV